MKSAPKRKICFPVMNRIHYARQKHLLDLLRRHPEIELQLVVGGSILLEKYGHQFLSAIKDDGFTINETLFNVIEGGNHITMAKTAALTGLEFANALHKLNPDIVLIRGDRFEQLAIAMVSAYMNKTVAHIEGGDLSGTIDESVRHAITKLAHLHFVTNKEARRRLIQMGENPRTVFHVGSPDVEFAAVTKKKLDPQIINSIGTGDQLDFKKPYLVIMHHPVTTEKDNLRNTEILLKAVDNLNIQAVWFWPNNDAGTNDVSKAIRHAREIGQLENHKIRFLTDVLPDDFIALLRDAKLLIGNSSAGIKECSYLGVPVVNLGTRQQNRLRGPNVLDAGYNETEIKKAIHKQLAHGLYPRSDLYYQLHTSQAIVDHLSTVRLYQQKKFYES